MKYLHSGYILLCEKAELTGEGRVNVHGLFDLCVMKSLPGVLKCQCVVGFGTPYERRQYKGYMEVDDPSGTTVFKQEFNANDPNDLFRGHAIVDMEAVVKSEGCWTIRCTLFNWKNENVWDVSRQLWAMIEDKVTAG